MNSELSAAGQQRIIVTTRDRGDYLAGLRGASLNANFSSYIAILSGLQRGAARLDYSQLAEAEVQLRTEQAFVDAEASSDAIGGILAVAQPQHPTISDE
jgi:hypothetical protein